jgi:hypothetical protein
MEFTEYKDATVNNYISWSGCFISGPVMNMLRHTGMRGRETILSKALTVIFILKNNLLQRTDILKVAVPILKIQQH